MIPMRREQGSRDSSGQFRSTPLSICVLQIRPWMISLNIPSPPTHTTLHGESTLSEAGHLISLARAATPAQPRPSPVKLLQLRLRLQVIPRMIGVLGHCDDNNAVFLTLQPHGGGAEVIKAERTDDVRADASPSKQWGHL